MKQNDLNFLRLALGEPEDTKKRPELAHAHTFDVPFYGTMMATSNGRFAHAVKVDYDPGREWDISGLYAREIGQSEFASMLEAVLAPPNPPQELVLSCWPKKLTASTLRNLTKARLYAVFHDHDEEFIFHGFMDWAENAVMFVPDRLVGVTAGGEVIVIANRALFFSACGRRIVAVAREK